MSKVEIDKSKLNKLYRIVLTFQLRNSGGLCGQAFTNYICLKCDQEYSHHNTNTPYICDYCKKEIRDEFAKEEL